MLKLNFKPPKALCRCQIQWSRLQAISLITLSKHVLDYFYTEYIECVE